MLELQSAWRAAGLVFISALLNLAHANDYRVDCSANDETAIKSLDELNKIEFAPGSRILFKRGTVCYGSFMPREGSSGRPGAPIVVNAYGDQSSPRPIIAAGCREATPDPDQRLTEDAKTSGGISPYHSLCKMDNGRAVRAALQLTNVDHWEINALELTNDGMAPGPRVGLLVQLEDFGVGHHYRVNDVYVHHVHGYQQEIAGSDIAYKETGGILFNITRNREQPGKKQKRTNFKDVLIQNSEVYNVNGIGISNRSAWGCRPFGANCADYPPYKTRPEYLKDPASAASSEFFPSTGLVIRNNKIHNIGGDGIIVRTATAPLVEANLIYDIWMRAAGDSAGAWAINTDDALFQYNEVYGVRKRENLGDGMAFDADLGTWNTVVRANYSHDNEGGLMLYCGCGPDGLGSQAKSFNAVVDNNLSVNDGYRIVVVNGAELGKVRANLIITNKAGVDAPLIESNKYPSKNEVILEGNVLVNVTGNGRLVRFTHRQGSFDDIRSGGNTFAGYAAKPGLPGTGQTNTFGPPSSVDADAMAERWFASSGFREHRYQPVRPGNGH